MYPTNTKAQAFEYPNTQENRQREAQEKASAFNYPARAQEAEKFIGGPTPPPKPVPSIFNKFFIVDDGVISFSQRNITLISCGIVTSFLLGMAYICCNDGTETCNWEHFPMISDMGKLHPYDRIFCLVMCFHCHTCLMSNIRAFYKLLYPLISPSLNSFLFYIGLGGACALPLVGYCDEDMYPLIHPCLATGFFICYVVYSFYTAAILKANKSKFDAAGQKNVDNVSYFISLMYFIAGVFVFNKFYYGSRFLGAMIEWSLALVLINFFVFVNLFNDFYDSVHSEAKLVHPNKAVATVQGPVEKVQEPIVYAYEPIDEILPVHTSPFQETPENVESPKFTEEPVVAEEVNVAIQEEEPVVLAQNDMI
jgi:hypothetical protein